MKRLEAIKRVIFLRSVSDTMREEIAAAGYERTLTTGEMLFAETEPCFGLLVVLTGAVKVYKLDARGREMILSVERPGSSVLDVPLFDGGNYPANAAAQEKDTSVFVVPHDRFQALLQYHPEIASAVVRHLAIQVRKLIEMLKAQTLHKVRSRLAAYLLNTARTEIAFPLTETNEAIGSHIGTVREVISRTLSAFEMEGLISRRGRIIRIERPDKLRRIADQTDNGV